MSLLFIKYLLTRLSFEAMKKFIDMILTKSFWEKRNNIASIRFRIKGEFLDGRLLISN